MLSGGFFKLLDLILPSALKVYLRSGCVSSRVVGLQLCSSSSQMFAATRVAVINGLSARCSQFAFLAAPKLRETQNIPSIRAASLGAASPQVSCTKPSRLLPHIRRLLVSPNKEVWLNTVWNPKSISKGSPTKTLKVNLLSDGSS